MPVSPRTFIARAVGVRLRRSFAALSMAVLAGPASAGNGVIEAQVLPLQDQVSYRSADLASFIGYEVVLANEGGNTINNIRFQATLAGPWPGSGASFHSAEGATCAAAGGGTSVECVIGQLRAGQAAPRFAIFFRAPQQVPPSGEPLCGGGECAELKALVLYAEGTGGLGTSTPQNSQLVLAPVRVGLGTVTSSRVRSALPRAGGLLQTGAAAVARASDPFTTRVNVPASGAYTTGEITEREAPGCTNFSPCFESDVRIPGEFAPYLSIVLRQDASTIRPGTKIGSVLLLYTPTSDAANPAPATQVLGMCASPTTPLSDRPCIAATRVYRKQDGLGADFEGDFEWTVISPRNGSYKVF